MSTTDEPEVASTLRSEGHDASEDGTGRQPGYVMPGDPSVDRTLTSSNGRLDSDTDTFYLGPSLRRLTGTERERLMGAPDGWCYPWGPSLADEEMSYPQGNCCPLDFKPDGRRDAATGDGVVVQVARWIAERLPE